MLNSMKLSAIALAFMAFGALAATRTAPLIIDHTYDFEAIPAQKFAEYRQAAPIIHLGHRSDGSAIPFGLGKLAEINPTKYPYSEGYLAMPDPVKGMQIWNGMSAESYVTPDIYYATKAGRDDLTSILTKHPSIKYASWTWCNEDDYYPIGPSQDDDHTLTDYFRVMDSLEQQFPNVTFIYQTAAIRDPGSDDAKVHQIEFNDSLRAWAIKHNKVLFDFADLDNWHAGEQHFETINGKPVKFQHPAWLEGNGATNGGHHANDSMGIDKGKAWWYMMVRLETGWTPSGSTAIKAKSAPGFLQNPMLSKSRFDLMGRIH